MGRVIPEWLAASSAKEKKSAGDMNDNKSARPTENYFRRYAVAATCEH
jgi:hypothetical protein